MTQSDVVKLVAFVSAASSTRVDPVLTPPAWFELLNGEVRSYEEALAATKQVLKRQPFVHPSDIIAEAQGTRRERLEVEAPGGNGPHPAYLDGRPVDPDDTAGWLEAKAAHRYVQPSAQQALPSRPVQELLARVRRSLPAAGGDQ